MNKGRSQFAVYRLKKDSDLTVRWHRSWHFLQEYRMKVTSQDYRQICMASLDPELEPADLRRQLENRLPAGSSGEVLETSDVLVVTSDGITTAYYVDPEKLIALTGFFRVSSSTPVLTIDTSDYIIEGRSGLWSAVEEIWIDGQQFFLMQNQQFGNRAQFAVLDSNGKTAAPDTAKGFSEEVKEQIRAYIHRGNAEDEALTGSASLKNGQRGSENGEYLRSAEMTEEQNYSMIDGRMNNMAPKPAARKRRPGKRRNGKLPLKGRESVLKRLKEYQEELAMQRGHMAGQGGIEHQERQ